MAARRSTAGFDQAPTRLDRSISQRQDGSGFIALSTTLRPTIADAAVHGATLDETAHIGVDGLRRGPLPRPRGGSAGPASSAIPTTAHIMWRLETITSSLGKDIGSASRQRIGSGGGALPSTCCSIAPRRSAASGPSRSS